MARVGRGSRTANRPRPQNLRKGIENQGRATQNASQARGGDTAASRTIRDTQAVKDANRARIQAQRNADLYGNSPKLDWQQEISTTAQQARKSQSTQGAQAVQGTQAAQSSQAVQQTESPTKPTADYSAVQPKNTGGNLDSRAQLPGLNDVKVQARPKAYNGGRDPSVLNQSPLAKRTDEWLPQLANSHNKPSGKWVPLKPGEKPQQVNAGQFGNFALQGKWVAEPKPESAKIPYGDSQKMSDLRQVGEQIGTLPPGKSPKRVRKQVNELSKLNAKNPAKFDQKLNQLVRDQEGRDYIKGAKNDAELRARATTVLESNRVVADYAKHMQKTTDTGGKPGESAIPWTKSAIDRTNAYGEKKGVINDAIKADSEKTADTLLGINEGSNLSGPPVKMDARAYGQALVERIPANRINEASAVGAVNYINNAKTLGEQKERVAGTLQSFQTLDKVGRSPTTMAEKVKDLGNVSPELVRELGGSRANRAYDRVAPYVGVPGKFKIPLDKSGKRTLRLRNDANGNVEKADYKKKKTSFFKKALGAVLTVASIIPSPIQPFAAAANGVMGAINGFKSGNVLGGLASAAGAFAGVAGGIGKMVGGTALNATAKTLGGASRVLGGISSVAQGIKNKDLGSIISGAAGLVANGAGAASQGLKNAAENVQNLSNAVTGIKNKDVAGVLAAGSGLAATAGNQGLADNLRTGALAASTIQAAKDGNINGVAAGLAGLGVDAYERNQAAKAAQAQEAAAAANNQAASVAPESLAPGDNGVAPAQGATANAAADPASATAEASTPAEAGANASTAYTVRPGDTLSEIAAKSGTTVDALMQANPDIKDANQIRSGQVVNVPDADGNFASTAKDVLDSAKATVSNAKKVVKLGQAAGALKNVDEIAKTLSEASYALSNVDADIARLRALPNPTAAQASTLSALEEQRTGLARTIRTGVANANSLKVLDKVGKAFSVYDAATKESQVSIEGKVANYAAQSAVGGMLAKLSPALAIGDTAVGLLDAGLAAGGVDPKYQVGTYISPGKVLGSSVDNITGFADAVYSGDTKGLESLHERNLSGKNGWLFQQAANAGEYWAQYGITGGLKNFWNTVTGP
jgi:LysM repeat protein